MSSRKSEHIQKRKPTAYLRLAMRNEGLVWNLYLVTGMREQEVAKMATGIEHRLISVGFHSEMVELETSCRHAEGEIADLCAIRRLPEPESAHRFC
jgi:hypothetical protein